MKNNALTYIAIIPLITLFLSCSKKINYKYQDKEQLISCNTEDDKLLNEALHSFEFDIATYYEKTVVDIESFNIETGYYYFIHNGAMGSADYKEIVSSHSLQILKRLKEKGFLTNTISPYSNLNYKNETISCIINNMKNEKLKNSLHSQVEVNYLNPKLMADTYRIAIDDAFTDRYFALFIALETYYQYLADLNITK
ncbi:MAG: hypothetical protein ACI9EK_000541 [Psychroserpens sp.]|jgi:hypothetical protein